MIARLTVLLAALCLTGCDQISQRLGMEDPAAKEARLEPEARAVGSACRHSGRAIEDCYAIYGWLPKAGIYAGWREMDEYMRQNQIETIAPQLPPPEPPGAQRKKRKTAEEAPAAPPAEEPAAAAPPPASAPAATAPATAEPAAAGKATEKKK